MGEAFHAESFLRQEKPLFQSLEIYPQKNSLLYSFEQGFGSKHEFINNLKNYMEMREPLISIEAQYNYLQNLFTSPNILLPVPKKPAALPAPAIVTTPVTQVPREYSAADLLYTFLRDGRARQELLERMLAITVAMESAGVNAVAFCDRGARPLATLIAQLWPGISDRPLPAFFFVNTDPKRAYHFNAEEIPQEVLDQLASWLASQYPEGENPLRDGGARVVVLDENYSTGKTANFLADILKRAFGDTIEEAYCEWANVPDIPWRNDPRMIGADTVPGEFKSRELATEQAHQLQEDLIRLVHGVPLPN